MKKMLIAVLLGVFFICACSANAAQDSKQDTSMVPGIVADQAASAYADALSMEKLAREYEEAGNVKDAKKTWVALLAKVTNGEPMLYSRYFEFLNRIGDVSAALEQLKKLQQFYPANFYAFRMADLLVANKKLDEAKAVLIKLISETEDIWVIEDAKGRLKTLDSLASKTPSLSDVPPVYTLEKKPK